MAAAADFTSLDILEELQARCAAELGPLVRAHEPDLDALPVVQRSRELDKARRARLATLMLCQADAGCQADFTMLWAPVCARRKVVPGVFTAALAAAVQARFP